MFPTTRWPLRYSKLKVFRMEKIFWFHSEVWLMMPEIPAQRTADEFIFFPASFVSSLPLILQELSQWKITVTGNVKCSYLCLTSLSCMESVSHHTTAQYNNTFTKLSISVLFVDLYQHIKLFHMQSIWRDVKQLCTLKNIFLLSKVTVGWIHFFELSNFRSRPQPLGCPWNSWGMSTFKLASLQCETTASGKNLLPFLSVLLSPSLCRLVLLNKEKQTNHVKETSNSVTTFI